MWERTLSQKLVRLFCEQKVIDEAKADAYVYGYELLISSVVSVLLVVLIAVVCGDVRYALSFLIGFIPQRIYIGGYHATSHTRCYLAFSGLALICILLSKAIAANHLFRILTTVALLGISIFLSPIEAKNMTSMMLELILIAALGVILEWLAQANQSIGVQLHKLPSRNYDFDQLWMKLFLNPVMSIC